MTKTDQTQVDLTFPPPAFQYKAYTDSDRLSLQTEMDIDNTNIPTYR